MTIRKENIHAVLTDLATRYPRAFAREKYRPHRPLKVGVAADILACCPDLDRRKLGLALAAYTRRRICEASSRARRASISTAMCAAK